MRDLERQVAVIRQQNQTLGMKVETSDRIDALAHAAHEIDDRAAALRIFDRRHHFSRFVQQDVAMRFGVRDQLAVDLDVIVCGIGARSELGDDTAVDRDSPLPDHRLCFAA